MPGHRFKITVEALSDRQGNPVEKAPLSFEVENHDDIFDIVERIQAREDLNFGRQQSAAFAVGLKLFSEVMIENRKHPVFAPLREAFKAFMVGLKKGPTE
ncbi:Domain of Uncharacterised Function with PDB structure [Serratia entomophila]|jgi:hypothetical protein|uniref:DUF3861 domain-containing protein n=1 Tax=Serratia entomophila TaxID=42906 RepID=A0ABY5CXP7_9GAMM|nr:DUF3861 domain-containing protein [Serratia entomophila]UIW19576.1 DUF3861 domain-containing protein [Serratia entomophila]USV02102.1 DUF3861 domain-containing protein [Serratia entomophila]CAI0698154.1 Domain of Uncharacterised Function with PDB structure [Serratia entomophila]CAI0726705.1 Domain of Uncharacterised Function with PDB structure [Serratia entomophila]CAI0757790.1 Domain of Uncharacterised Function with PDB structure [Serratia entomophila]